MQVASAYAAVLVHFRNLPKMASVPHAHGKVRERMLSILLEKDGKPFVAVCPRGCGVTHCGFCVWDCSLFCVLDSLHSHWWLSGTLFLPLLSARCPGCITLFPLRNCLLSEITGIGTVAPVLLMA